jgi:hypothetical protein
VKYIHDGSNNTKYFHLTANGKHRKKKIFQLEQEEGIIVGMIILRYILANTIKIYISKYYQKLFGNPEPSSITLNENRI